MPESNIDQLLQVTAKVDWQTSGPVGAADDSSAFDSHLAQAATRQTPSPAPCSPGCPPPVSPTSTGDDTTDAGTASEETGTAGVAPPAVQNHRNSDNADGETPDKTEGADDPAAAAASATADHIANAEADAGEDMHNAADDAAETVPAVAVVGSARVPNDTPPLTSDATNSDAGTADAPDAKDSGRPAATAEEAGPRAPSSDDEAKSADVVDELIAIDEAGEIEPQRSNVRQDAAEPAGPHPADAERGAATKIPIAEGERAPAVAVAQLDRAEKQPRNRRAAAVDHASTADAPTKADGQQSSPPAEKPASKRTTEKKDPSSQKSSDDSATSVVESRFGLKPSPAATNAKFAVVAAVKDAASNTADETSKSDATGEPPRIASTPDTRTGHLLHPLAKLHRAASASGRAARTAERDESPNVDSARFVGRVTRAFHTAQERGGTLQIRLSPPELGALRLELMVKEGVLAASLETDNPTARRVLLDHLPALRERLAEQNIRIERFDVDVRQESGGQSQSGTQHHRQQPSPPQVPSRNSSSRSTPAAEAKPATPVSGARAGDTRINLVA